MNEKLYFCLFYPDCSCFFFSQSDLDRHMKAFVVFPIPINHPMLERDVHLAEFKKRHRQLEGFWDE